MLCSREGNHTSGVALAMQHRLHGLSTYGLTATEREMSTPPMVQTGAWYTVVYSLSYTTTSDISPNVLDFSLRPATLPVNSLAGR